MRLDVEYVLPLRWSEDSGLAELVSYLGQLCEWVDVTVVDGSEPARFARHAAAFPADVRHIVPEPWPGRNGKVGGVMTGVHHARHDTVVLADDDVRYSLSTLRRLTDRVPDAALVVPQNFFLSNPWHARLDTARSLINRAFGGDYPGTFALSRRALVDAGGYDGDVLFENLELMRTIRAYGGTVVRANDVFVDRLPPTSQHFVRQRVRQAYDDFAQPGRLIAELLYAPVLVALAVQRLAPRAVVILGAAGLVTATAEFGRRRGNGGRRFPRSAALWAPLWVVERAICVWVAVGARMRGGAKYSGGRVRRAGNSPRVIRQRVERVAA